MKRLLAVLVLTLAAHAQTLQESIEVRRTIIDVHVADAQNHVITDLTPADFIVRVDGKEAKVESVTWVGDGMPSESLFTDDPGTSPEPETEAGAPPEATPAPAPAAAPHGRVFVLFVQTDFARFGERVVGEMGVIDSFHAFVDLLQPDDRVALFSFDSHLKLRLDFSTDRDQLQKIFPTVLAIDNPVAPASTLKPSLAALLDPAAMKNAATSEQALILLARALRHIDGPKTLVLFGWGMGEPLHGRPYVSPDTLRAAGELNASRVTVHTFNFGLGGQMSASLQEVSHDTGGLYAAGRPNAAFSKMEVRFLPQLESYLQGHMELEIISPVPAVPGKLHRLEIRTKRRDLTVIGKTSFVDAD